MAHFYVGQRNIYNGHEIRKFIFIIFMHGVFIQDMTSFMLANDIKIRVNGAEKCWYLKATLDDERKNTLLTDVVC